MSILAPSAAGSRQATKDVGDASRSVGGRSHAFAPAFLLLGPHLAELDRCLHAQLQDFEPEIRVMADYCIDAAGKRIRPALVFFSGWQEPGLPASDLVRAAAVIELIHLATLVHDDIMDGADLRRNRRTAAREYGPTVAVLLGDALFAHALHLATQFSTTEVCAAVSESTRRVCAGEIAQTLRRGSVDVTRADYERMIDLKTAELFRVSCFLGSRLAGLEPGFVEAAARFGRHLGIAYQIYDDLIDFFGEENRAGKTLGTDFVNGKLTLPLFVLLERLPPPEREALEAEVAGQYPPQLAKRLRQMKKLGVFSAGVDAVNAELAAAGVCLAPWAGLAPTKLLLGLADLLRGQLAALKS